MTIEEFSETEGERIGRRIILYVDKFPASADAGIMNPARKMARGEEVDDWEYELVREWYEENVS